MTQRNTQHIKKNKKVAELRKEIDDLDDSQKAKQRELWRKQKRRQKDKNNESN